MPSKPFKFKPAKHDPKWPDAHKVYGLKPENRYPHGSKLCTAFLNEGHQSDLRIDKTTKIFTMGSCFAVNINAWLKDNGFTVLDLDKPDKETCIAFNVFTLEQETDRALGSCDQDGLEQIWAIQSCNNIIYVDPFRHFLAWNDKQSLLNDRVVYQEQLKHIFESMDIFIFTAGQTEIWYNGHSGLAYSSTPPPSIYDRSRDVNKQTSFEDNLATIEEAWHRIKRHNPNAKMIITVSPVPLKATFQGGNAVVAAEEAKATLRAVVAEFANTADDVYYFPAYELVRSNRDIREPFLPDNRHVKEEAVAAIMQMFQARYVD